MSFNFILFFYATYVLCFHFIQTAHVLRRYKESYYYMFVRTLIGFFCMVILNFIFIVFSYATMTFPTDFYTRLISMMLISIVFDSVMIFFRRRAKYKEKNG